MALAGVTITVLIITIYMAFIMLIGMGATSIISIKLDENRTDHGERIMGDAFVLFMIMGISLAGFGLMFLEPILVFFGARVDIEF